MGRKYKYIDYTLYLQPSPCWCPPYTNQPLDVFVYKIYLSSNILYQPDDPVPGVPVRASYFLSYYTAACNSTL